MTLASTILGTSPPIVALGQRAPEAANLFTGCSKMSIHQDCVPGSGAAFGGSPLSVVAGQTLADGNAVGWTQGRMEFGPRALGNRSILGDPRSPKMQKALNLRVKYRESFRPFAPSVLREDVATWFDLDGDSPYMLLVAPVLAEHRRDMSEEEQAQLGIDKLNVPRSSIPAVTHVDYSAHVQTAHADTDPRYHALISAFKGSPAAACS